MTKNTIRGFALVTCQPKLETPTIEKAQVCSYAVSRIKSIHGVKDAFPTSKPSADIVVFIEAESYDEIDNIIEQIKNTSGILDVKPKIEILV